MPRSTLHWWIKEKLLPIFGRSLMRGIENLFTEPEIVQAVVLDILASMGALRDRKNLSVSFLGDKLRYIFPGTGEFGDNEVGFTLSDLDAICRFYLAYDFHVLIFIEVEHRRHPVSRYYSITYRGADDEDMAAQAVAHWQSRKVYGSDLSLAFIDVRRVWEELNFGLGFRLDP
jgi:hypothetical protein